MAKVFKIWIDIEEYDTDTDEGTIREDLNMGVGASVAVFDTEGEALAFAQHLQAIGEGS